MVPLTIIENVSIPFERKLSPWLATRAAENHVNSDLNTVFPFSNHKGITKNTAADIVVRWIPR